MVDGTSDSFLWVEMYEAGVFSWSRNEDAHGKKGTKKKEIEILEPFLEIGRARKLAEQGNWPSKEIG